MLVWISRFVDACDACVVIVMKQELEYQADYGLLIQIISLNNVRELLINFTEKYFSRFIICDSAIVLMMMWLNQCAKMQSILVNNEHQKHIWISAQETLKTTQAKCFAYFSARG